MERLRENMTDVKHTMAVISGKGGVGKSTIAVNLAYTLSADKKVGLLDADITGPNVQQMTGTADMKAGASDSGINPVDAGGVKTMSVSYLMDDADTPIIWRGPLRGNVIMQFLSDVRWGELDYLIVDLPPGTGDESLTVAQTLPGIDGFIVVTTPQEVSVMDARKAVNFGRRLNVPVLGVIENMAGMRCPHCGKDITLFGVGGGEKAAAELKVPFLGGIPFTYGMTESCDAGRPYVREHMGEETTSAFNSIVDNIKANMR